MITKPFKEVATGSIFEYEDSVYIKTSDHKALTLSGVHNFDPNQIVDI